MTADVVSLAERPSLRVKSGKPVYCEHWRVSVDQTRRMLECRDCGAAVEPFDWLLKAAKHEESVFATIKKLRLEKTELEEEIGRQRSELLGLKAQLPHAARAARAAAKHPPAINDVELTPAVTAGGGSGGGTPEAARGELA